MTEQEIIKIIRCGETSTVQFKQRFTSAKQIAEEFVAFANSKGGRLIFGVEDKTGKILGLSYEEIQSASRELGNVANDQVRPTIFLQTETVEVEGNMLLVADIQEGLNKPYKDLQGNIYVKQGADKRRLTENTEILRLFHESLAQKEALLAQMKEDFAQINESLAQKIAELAQKNELTDLQVNILKYIALNSSASRADLANKIVDATIDKVKHSLARLQDLGVLLRQGSKRSGHWEILFN